MRRLLLATAVSAVGHVVLLAAAFGPAVPRGVGHARPFAVAIVERQVAGSGSAAARHDDGATRPVADEAAAAEGARVPPKEAAQPPAPAVAAPARERPAATRSAPDVAASVRAAAAAAPRPARERQPTVTRVSAREAAPGGHARADSAGRPGAPAAGVAGAPATRLAAVPSSGDAGAAGDLRPLCVSCPSPEYPARARRRGWQGTVEIGLAVTRDGRVEDVRVAQSSGFGALDSAAVAVARRSRFVLPGGQSVVRGKLRYRFRLEGPL